MNARCLLVYEHIIILFGVGYNVSRWTKRIRMEKINRACARGLQLDALVTSRWRPIADINSF